MPCIGSEITELKLTNWGLISLATTSLICNSLVLKIGVLMSTKVLRGEEEVRNFGIQIGRRLKRGQVLGLIGNLGTGKTTLTKYIGEGLGVKEEIISPTFNIVTAHYSGRLPLYHFDVYRLTREEELFEIGFQEYIEKDGVVIVEWADMVIGEMPEDADYIFIDYTQTEGERVYNCTF